MPGPGEQIQTRTQERDAMFGRMASMAPRRSLVDGIPKLENPVPGMMVDDLQVSNGPAPEPGAYAKALANGSLMTGGEGSRLILNGSVLEAVGPGSVRSAITDVLKTYTNIGLVGATPDHQWRAAEHFRPFHAIEALTQAMEKLIDERVQLSLRAVARSAPDDGAS